MDIHVCLCIYLYISLSLSIYLSRNAGSSWRIEALAGRSTIDDGFAWDASCTSFGADHEAVCSECLKIAVSLPAHGGGGGNVYSGANAVNEEDPERDREEEEEEEEEGLFKADAVNEEDPERDRATQV